MKMRKGYQESIIVKDESDIPIYEGYNQKQVDHFIRNRNRCIKRVNWSENWMKSKNKIDFGGGRLIFGKGDIYGTKID